MKIRELPGRETLQQLLQYDAETGVLRWRQGRLAGKQTGSARAQGYLRVFIQGQQYLAHRLIWKMIHDAEPEFIDHLDGRRDNNRLSNLRAGPKADNSKNAALRRDNRSGLSGVRQRGPNLWQARIRIDGAQRHLGNFRTREEAHAAWNEAAARNGYSARHGRRES